MTQAELAKPPNAKDGGARPATPHAAAIPSAIAKSGTGSSNQPIAPPTMTRLICHPASVRPAGAGMSQSAAGMPTVTAEATMRDSGERRGSGAATIERSRSRDGSGAPTRLRSLWSIVLASERAMANPRPGRSRARRSKRSRGMRQAWTAEIALTVAVRSPRSTPNSPKVAGAKIDRTDRSAPSPRTLTSTVPLASR